MSEADQHKQQAEAALQAKREDRWRAHRYLRDHYLVHGLDEADRDEVMGALGILTESDMERNLDLYVDRALSRAGLTVNAVRGPAPRTPPSRGA